MIFLEIIEAQSHFHSDDDSCAASLYPSARSMGSPNNRVPKEVTSSCTASRLTRREAHFEDHRVGHEKVAHFDHCGFAGFTPDPALKFGMRSASPPLNQPFVFT
jgi:hypothetical protein